MSKFTCPARYRHVVAGAIAMAMHDIVTDMRAREAGRPSTMPDFSIDETDAGSLLITVEDSAAPAHTITRDGVDLAPELPAPAVPLRIAS